MEIKHLSLDILCMAVVPHTSKAVIGESDAKVGRATAAALEMRTKKGKNTRRQVKAEKPRSYYDFLDYCKCLMYMIFI